VRKQNALYQVGRRPTSSGWFALLAGALATSCLVSALVLLWFHATHPAQPYRAPTAIVLVILSALQARFALRLWRRQHTRSLDFAQRSLFWKSLFAGGVLCYVAGLFLGPNPGVGYLFVAGLAIWYTVALAVLVVPPPKFSGWLQRNRNGFLQRFGHALVASLMLSVGAEAVLRLYSLLADDPLPASYVASTLALPPGEHHAGQLVNAEGYWDEEFRRQPRPGVFRIAVLGDGVTLSGSAQTNLLSRVERTVPGIEIYNFGLPAAGPREYAAQLMHTVASYHPDLVLTFFSVGDDVTEEVPLPGMFDWRNLRLYQWSARSGFPRDDTASLVRLPAANTASREEYLSHAAARLDVCRTPISDDLSRRWHDATKYLGEIDEYCRRRGIAAALVVVPSELQVNAQLCETVRRRTGLEAKNVDINLPQRRLVDFAHQRELPVVDLLPPLRAASGTLYARNQHHWNERGHAVAAEALGRWIKHRYGSQLGATTHAALP
jgi:hypothetical protein